VDRRARRRCVDVERLLLAETVRRGEGNAIGGGSQVFRSELVSFGGRSLYNAPTDSILVFHAGMLMGGLDVLRMMRPDDVRVVRHISAVDAYHKYGRVVSIGALEIELVHE
jgi:CO dehydrogenase/acetyl-CoA synthase delta subunit